MVAAEREDVRCPAKGYSQRRVAGTETGWAAGLQHLHYNSEENEENARWTVNQLGALFTRVAVDADWNITPSRDGATGGYHFYPHKIKGEGLFVTVLQKQDAEQSEADFIPKKTGSNPLSSSRIRLTMRC